MTPAYKARREAKHAAQAAAKVPQAFYPVNIPTIDLAPRMAAHAFVGLKTRPQANGGRENRSGYAQERKQADIDNAAYDAQPKSIGGIPETGGLPEGTNGATPNVGRDEELDAFVVCETGDERICT